MTLFLPLAILNRRTWREGRRTETLSPQTASSRKLSVECFVPIPHWKPVIQQIRRIGRDLFASGLVSSHAGNVSVRIGDCLIITRRGSMLGRLGRSDLVNTTVRTPNPADEAGSSELPVHRAIYERTTASAVVHAHPAHAVALSLLAGTVIEPPDLEAEFLLGSVPIVTAPLLAISGEAIEAIPVALGTAKIVVVRGHGTFAVGQDLEEAYHWTSVLEHSCRISFLLRGAGRR